MNPDPILSAVSVTNPTGTHSIKTPQGEHLILDPGAKLAQRCTVAVFLAGHSCWSAGSKESRYPIGAW
jgi:hypothetical protein